MNAVERVLSLPSDPRLSRSHIIREPGARALSTFTMEGDRRVKGLRDVVTAAGGDGAEWLKLSFQAPVTVRAPKGSSPAIR